MKNNLGITLVSLVITIVIMLILAGVSISFVIGKGGLFTKSKDSVNTYSEKAQDEKSDLNNVENYMDNITNNNDGPDESGNFNTVHSSIDFSSRSLWEQGGIRTDGYEATSDDTYYLNRIRTKGKVRVDGGAYLKLIATDTSSNYLKYTLYYYKADGTYLHDIDWYTNQDVVQVDPQADYIRIALAYTADSTDTSSKISVNLLSAAYYEVVNNEKDNYTWESGSFASADGTPITATDRIREINKITVIPNTNFRAIAKDTSDEYFMYSVYYYDVDQNYIEDTSWYNYDTTITVPSNAHYVKVILKYSDSRTINVSDLKLFKVE